MKNKITFIIISLLTVISMLIISIGLASANTLVGGTIYDTTPDNPVSGAEITVQCDAFYLDTISLSDGTYAVVFNKETCSSINAYAKDESYSAMKLSVYIKDDTNEEEGDIGRPSGSGKIYLCGNGICDSGETPNTCLRDCPLEPESIQPQSIQEGESSGQPEVITLEQNSDVSGNAPITGAVTGTSERSYTLFIIIISLLLVTIVFFILKYLVKKEDISEYS